MLGASGIFEYQSYNPQQNFSRADKRENPEEKFAIKFVRSYLNKFMRIHSGTSKDSTLLIREFPVSGNGIADLLVLSWPKNLTLRKAAVVDLEQLNPTVRAFEFKLSDWRGGLMQAHRYKSFSHASILVLPQEKLSRVRPQLSVFRTLRVGLWGFSPETGTIVPLYTPRPKQQQFSKYEQKVLHLAAQVLRS